jgi:hypothetical protein
MEIARAKGPQGQASITDVRLMPRLHEVGNQEWGAFAEGQTSGE